MALGFFIFFVVNYLETDLDDFFSSPNFRTKIALFFRKYCYNPVKILADKFFNATAMFYILYDCDDLNHKAVRPLHSGTQAILITYVFSMVMSPPHLNYT